MGARPVAIGIVLVTLFSFFMVFPTHDPKPRGLPVGIVGDASEPPAPPGGSFDVRRFRQEEDAVQAIRDREIYAAIGPHRTVVASGASFQVAQLAGDGPNVRDIVPLDPDDPRGTTIQFAVLALTVPGILGAMLLVQMAPALDGRGRVALLSLFSLLAALAAMLVIRVGIGSLPGSFLGLVGVSTLGIMALSLASAAIIVALGPPGIMVSFLLFLMLGNPGSGAASAPELLPEPWQTGGQLLPPGALGTAIRDVAYFDGAALAQPLIVLALFAAAGAAVLLSKRGPSGPSPQPA